MSNLPEVNDRVDVWVTLSYGVTSASILRTYRVAFAFGLSLPEYNVLVNNISSRHWLSLSPVMGDGDYDMGVTLKVYRGGSLLETVIASYPMLTIAGQGNRLPPGVAPVSSFRPTDGKSRQVSRLYWPHVSVSHLGNDTLLSIAGQTAINNQANTFLGTIDWGGSGYSVRVHNYIVEKSTDSWYRLTSVLTHREIGTQRRRNRGNQKLHWG